MLALALARTLLGTQAFLGSPVPSHARGKL